ncbi:MBL fold metallo-hydrolase [Maricurvus nonylphenolicus]|uniref:MBL fold metallo-hydrolase n=1 Tax=Maricurvus nonylphenolicus TaxID=1008307 RepID=UPI0036F239BE
MKLTAIEGNTQKLDGGAMFGNAPKALWSRWIEPDELNRIPLACRALLIQSDGENILLEAGVGAFFEPELRKRYGITEASHCLLDNLAQVGLQHADIDRVILSHLHFDHAGGLLSQWQEGEEPSLLFPNAEFIVSSTNWERARNPHARDRASFIKTLNQQLADSGRLRVIEDEATTLLNGKLRFHFSDGHTPGLMLTEITTPDGPLVFSADLIPAAPWVHTAIGMGYDRFPELLINEKTTLLRDLVARNGRLFLTHDASHPCVRVTADEKQRYSGVPCEL